jgi:hypothetical protein
MVFIEVCLAFLGHAMGLLLGGDLCLDDDAGRRGVCGRDVAGVGGAVDAGQVGLFDGVDLEVIPVEELGGDPLHHLLRGGLISLTTSEPPGPRA